MIEGTCPETAFLAEVGAVAGVGSGARKEERGKSGMGAGREEVDALVWRRF